MKVNHFESRLKFGKACTKDLRKLYFKSLVKNCLTSSKFLSNPFKDILGDENLKNIYFTNCWLCQNLVLQCS